MSLPDWREEPIAKKHDRASFDCGEPAHGLGGQLLMAAGRRCLLAAAEIGGVALLIDATNERAAAWYASYGAVPLADVPLSLVLSLATVRAALEAAGKL